MLGGALYLAVQVIPPYWTYFSMHDAVKGAVLAVVAGGHEGSARLRLVQRAQELDLTLTDEQIEFIRDASLVVVRIRWVATVDLPGYRHRIPFVIEERARAH